MRKVILKTALITFGVVLVLAVAAFGVASLIVPAAMSDLTYSLGMDVISSDYAYQEYERSGDLFYLSRSFEIAASRGRDAKAEERFDVLYAADGFDEMCEERTESTQDVSVGGAQIVTDYRDYVCGLGACVKYRLAVTAEEEQEALDLAIENTKNEFPAGNPVYRRAAGAAGEKDAAFCQKLLAAIRVQGFEENELFTDLVNILEVTADE